MELGSGALYSFSKTFVLPAHLPLYAKHTSFPCSMEREMHSSREVNKTKSQPDWVRSDCCRWVLANVQSYKDQELCMVQPWTRAHKSDRLTKIYVLATDVKWISTLQAVNKKIKIWGFFSSLIPRKRHTLECSHEPLNEVSSISSCHAGKLSHQDHWLC